jgi:hypothetical protein
MKIMAAVVAALVTASWAGHDVTRINCAFAFIEIGEEKNRPLARLASHNDIPCALLGFEQ